MIRVSAIAAIVVGLLRATTAFIPETTPKVYVLYFVIDVLLLIGVIGLHWSSVAGGKIGGRLGFALMCIALLVLIARDIGAVPSSAYAGAAAAFSLGLDVFAIQSLRTGKISSWIPISWILSTIIGPVGFFVPGLQFLFAVAGLLFGVAFTSAGVVMLLDSIRRTKAKRQL